MSTCFETRVVQHDTEQLVLRRIRVKMEGGDQGCGCNMPDCGISPRCNLALCPGRYCCEIAPVWLFDVHLGMCQNCAVVRFSRDSKDEYEKRKREYVGVGK
jgi:hypothetical protein